MQSFSYGSLSVTLPWLFKATANQVEPSQGYHSIRICSYLSLSSSLLCCPTTPTYTHLAISHPSLHRLDLLLEMPLALSIWQRNLVTLPWNPFATPNPHEGNYVLLLLPPGCLTPSWHGLSPEQPLYFLVYCWTPSTWHNAWHVGSRNLRPQAP